MTARPDCWDECTGLLHRLMAEQHVEIVVGIEPPLVSGVFSVEGFRCPHGIVYYCEPTSEQRMRWAQERAP